MEFDTENVDADAAVIRFRGRLNMVAAPRLRTAVSDIVASGRRRVVIDLSTIDFMDSSGLGALIAGLRTTRAAGGDLRIAAPTAQVATVLKLTNLDRILRPYESVEGALGDGT